MQKEGFPTTNWMTTGKKDTATTFHLPFPIQKIDVKMHSHVQRLIVSCDIKGLLKYVLNYFTYLIKLI